MRRHRVAVSSSRSSSNTLLRRLAWPSSRLGWLTKPFGLTSRAYSLGTPLATSASPSTTSPVSAWVPSRKIREHIFRICPSRPCPLLLQTSPTRTLCRATPLTPGPTHQDPAHAHDPAALAELSPRVVLAPGLSRHAVVKGPAPTTPAPLLGLDQIPLLAREDGTTPAPLAPLDVALGATIRAFHDRPRPEEVAALLIARTVGRHHLHQGAVGMGLAQLARPVGEAPVRIPKPGVGREIARQ
jgi:hypothetical protein